MICHVSVCLQNKCPNFLLGPFLEEFSGEKKRPNQTHLAKSCRGSEEQWPWPVEGSAQLCQEREG